MPLPKLLIRPDKEGYGFSYGPAPKAVTLDGGAPRYRRDYIGKTTQLTVQWVLKANQYDYIMAFYRTAISDGSLPFLIDLLMENSTISEYTVQIVPETFKLLNQAALVFTVGATLEVFGNPPGATADNATISGYTP